VALRVVVGMGVSVLMAVLAAVQVPGGVASSVVVVVVPYGAPGAGGVDPKLVLAELGQRDAGRGIHGITSLTRIPLFKL
jgi:hypothetical protein